MKLSIDQFMLHNLFLPNVDPGFLVDGNFAASLYGIVLDFCQSCRLWRARSEIARVLGIQESSQLGLRWLKQRGVSEVYRGSGVGVDDNVAGLVRLIDT